MDSVDSMARPSLVRWLFRQGFLNNQYMELRRHERRICLHPPKVWTWKKGGLKGIGKQLAIANVACYFVGWLKVVGGSASRPVARSCSTLRARSSAAGGICGSSLGLYTRLTIPSC